MKKLLIIALLCWHQMASAENLVRRDGTVYRNVTIISANPERMLIVHDGGGCQVEYVDLAGVLSAGQRKSVEEGLKVYAARKVRLEQLRKEAEIKRLEEEAFARKQQERGLVLFEGAWMKPVDRQELLAARELARLERERISVELEKQKAELQKAQYLAEQERQRLNEYRRSSSISFYYSYPSSRSGKNCRTPAYYGNSFYRSNNNYNRSSCYPGQSGGSISMGRGLSSMGFSGR
jgi:hypothetical protein